MTLTRTRWGSTAAMMGGLLWMVLVPLITLTYPGRSGWGRTDTLLGLAWEDYNRMLPAVLLLLLAGLAGLRVRYAGRSGSLGKVGFAVALVGLALMLAGNVVEFWVAGGIREQMTALDLAGWIGYSLGYLLLAVGLVLVGVACLKLNAFPGWNALPLLMGLLVLPMYVTVTSGNAVGAVLAVPFGLGWVVLGYALWSGEGEQHAMHARGVPAAKTPQALQPDDSGGRLANAAVACGLLALPLWLLSFSWIPFAVAGREIGSVWYIIFVGEAGALLAALLAIGSGFVARRRARPRTAQHRRASRGLVTGVTALVLVVGLNVLGAVFS